ncbi:MAG: hypothetical protein P9G45_06955, partial [Candidatus Contendobacter sp.]|nr:hypothetical protein [Candidatus Contendobacter sp.]
MALTDLKAQLQAELPELLKQDSGFRQWLEQLIRQTAVTPESFDARFERMLREFAADRAEQRRKWDEHDREWREWVAKFDAHTQEQARKWDEQNRKWWEWNDQFNAHAQEQNRKWDEQNRKWWEWNDQFN